MVSDRLGHPSPERGRHRAKPLHRATAKDIVFRRGRIWRLRLFSNSQLERFVAKNPRNRLESLEYRLVRVFMIVLTTIMFLKLIVVELRSLFGH